MTDSFIQIIHKDRPEPLKELDQVHMVPSSLRATYFKLSDYITDKNIVLIGDDDLMSLVFYNFCKPRNTIVLDIDKRILNHIDKLSKKFGFKVSTIRYNVLNSLPKSVLESSDFFYTNPPFGSKNKGDSCKAFILRGIEACKIGQYGAFVLPLREQNKWAKEVINETLKFVNKNGCTLVEIVRGLHQYENNPIRSSLFIIQKKFKTKPNTSFLEGITLY